ncbi:MAG: sugar phosphate isomerase/epimerase family protein [Limisphaerales bacterium]
MKSIDRRRFLRHVTLATTALAAIPSGIPGHAAEAGRRRFTLCLSPGSIGVKANQTEAIELAARHGFESVEPFADHLAGLAADQVTELRASLKAKGLVWGAAGLPVEFRRDDAAFAEAMKRLPGAAAGLQRAGATRVGTWLMPGDRQLTYVQNFRQHARRLREVGKVLGDHGLRLGMEYVGTFTLRAGQRFPFVHNLAGTRELAAEIGTGNVGVVLDSWHWWQAEDTVEDLLALAPADIISVDLNDAPKGVAKREQQDGRRELPVATGVIDVAAFVGALNRIGYDGPVRAEPFNKPLNDLDNEAACAATVAAMKKAVEGPAAG